MNLLERLGRIIEMGQRVARGRRTDKEAAMGSSGESSDSAWAHWLNAKVTLDGNGNESGSISRRMANISSALLTGGPVMNERLVFALFPLSFLGSPVYAQSPCSE